MNNNIFAERLSVQPLKSRVYVTAHFEDQQQERWLSLPRKYADVVYKTIESMDLDGVPLTRRIVAQQIGGAVVKAMPVNRENQICTAQEQERLIEYVNNNHGA
jgi:hypothetical protein